MAAVQLRKLRLYAEARRNLEKLETEARLRVAATEGASMEELTRLAAVNASAAIASALDDLQRMELGHREEFTLLVNQSRHSSFTQCKEEGEQLVSRELTVTGESEGRAAIATSSFRELLDFARRAQSSALEALQAEETRCRLRMDDDQVEPVITWATA